MFYYIYFCSSNVWQLILSFKSHTFNDVFHSFEMSRVGNIIFTSIFPNNIRISQHKRYKNCRAYYDLKGWTKIRKYVGSNHEGLIFY